MNISIIGSGYVGLGTLVGLSRNGHEVLCIDHDTSKVDLINRGIPPFHEEGLDELLPSCLHHNGGTLAFANYQQVLRTDVSFVCVDTPTGPDGSIDLTQIEAAITELGKLLAWKQSRHTVVLKSTVVPGTTLQFIIPLLEKCSGKKVGEELGVCVNPEFLQEGIVMKCSLDPYRIIIGESDKTTGDTVEATYNDFSAPILRTNIPTAEMIKYASNAFLGTKISFINEIGNICKKLGIDASVVAQGMGHDPRIGNEFLNAGIGFGGSCLPKDILALIHRARELDYEPRLLNAVSQINKDQPTRLLDIARERLGKIKNKVITVMGLSFKPNTDDIRHSPSISIIGQLLGEGAIVKAYDPQAMPKVKQIFSSNVIFCDSISDALHCTDCVLLLTEWDEFKDEELYRGKFVIDGRRTLDPHKAMDICEYEGICW